MPRAPQQTYRVTIESEAPLAAGAPAANAFKLVRSGVSGKVVEQMLAALLRPSRRRSTSEQEDPE